MGVALAVDKSPEAFRTISEVAVELDVPQHVLRFWETKFAHVKPLKRAGGRRYYRPEDLDLLRGIRSLLYKDGLTIKGAQKILREQGPRYVMELGRGAEWEESVPEALASWAKDDSCKGETILDDPPGPLSTVRYDGCTNGTEVRMIRIDGLGHTWTKTEVDTTGVMWQFFKSHRRAQ